MNELENLLVEIQRQTAAAKAVGQRLAAETVTEAIGGDLGAVVVNGYGELVDISLEHDKLRYTTEKALGRQVLEALRRAERRSAALRQQAWQPRR
ncbi:YbaB/EbfC family nucleoid-associated protein [Saccharopolyspora phatthalungensis]|uniref:DNA-binding protein YbaB n=1 Tax=Saccharopolyspora phatthalungensis TaxID=664693 RepID=A0A840Q9L7_9PSEU|nr:YbaB/EbfC family nucleoid-associated protein [Saccharopolyspora phatthalungensis]MBB5156431.1 DNA-binding protein YbaB [Saccharopolyspora phatthalungensis]